MLLSSSLQALERLLASASRAVALAWLPLDRTLLAAFAGDFFFDGLASAELCSLSILRLGVEGCLLGCSTMVKDPQRRR